MLGNCKQKSAYKIGFLKGYGIMTVDPEFANGNNVIDELLYGFFTASLISHLFRKNNDKQNLNFPWVIGRRS